MLWAREWLLLDSFVVWTHGNRDLFVPFFVLLGVLSILSSTSYNLFIFISQIGLISYNLEILFSSSHHITTTTSLSNHWWPILRWSSMPMVIWLMPIPWCVLVLISLAHVRIIICDSSEVMGFCIKHLFSVFPSLWSFLKMFISFFFPISSLFLSYLWTMLFLC